MNILDNSDWSSIEDEIIKHIPYIPSKSNKHNEWLSLAWTMKDAGIDKIKIDAWCQEGEIPESRWNSWPEVDDPEKIKIARLTLLKKAKENGFKADLGYTPKEIQFADSFDAELAQKLLDKLYKDDEEICWTLPKWNDKEKKFRPDGEKIMFHKRSWFTPEMMEHLKTIYHNGVYILLNHVDKNMLDEHHKENPAGGVLDKMVDSFKYYFIEMDDYEIEEQKKIINSLCLPWIGIVHSGRRSLHVYIRLDAKDRTEFKERIEKIHNYLHKKKIVFDTANKNPNRFCRGFWAGRLGKDETEGEAEQFVVAVNDNPISYEYWEKLNLKEYKFFIEKYDKNGNFTGYDIDEKEVYRWFTENGYVVAEYNNDFINAKINDKFISKKDKYQVIFNEFYLYVKEHFPNQFDVMLKHKDFYNKQYFYTLDRVDINIHNDEKDCTYLYFKNGFLKINADGCQLIPWTNFKGYIWDDAFNSLKRDFKLNKEKGQFEIYIEKISGNDTRKEILMSLFGFYLNRSKSQGNIHCLYLTDEDTDSESTISKGGTGKGTFFLGLEQFRKVLTVDGKTHDPNNRFALSDYKDGTNIILFDDVQSTFDPNELFVKISGNTRIEKKGKDIFDIPFEDSPKYGLTSNFVLKNMNSVSSGRRYNVFELKHFFSKENKIFNFFGNDFFEGGWDEEEWNKFDTFACRCSQLYFKKGVIEEKNNNFVLKSLLKSVPICVRNFLIEKILPTFDEKKTFVMAELFNEFEQYIINHPIERNSAIKSSDSFKEAVITFFSPGCKIATKPDGTKIRSSKGYKYVIDPDDWTLRNKEEIASIINDNDENHVSELVSSTEIKIEDKTVDEDNDPDDPFLGANAIKIINEDKGFIDEAPDYKSNEKRVLTPTTEFKKNEQGEIIGAKEGGDYGIAIMTNGEEVPVKYTGSMNANWYYEPIDENIIFTKPDSSKRKSVI